MIRLRAKPATAEFHDVYRAALAALSDVTPEEATKGGPAAGRAAAPGSLSWLCQRYYTSAEFKRLTERTRYVRRAILERACAFEDDGSKPYRLLESRHIRERRDELADRPEAANAYVAALRQVFGWAVADTVRLATRNPARDVPYLSSANPDGFHTWTVEEIRQFEARHPLGTKAHLALSLLLFTGVRRSDAVTLGRQLERDGWLHFTEIKGRRRLTKQRAIPILPALRAAIDAAPSGHLTYLVIAFNKPFTANGFGNWFRRRCNEAGLSHCSAHGLRKAGATIAAENGATEHQLMAIYGWESPKQAALYTRRADRRRLTGDAMHLIAVAPPIEAEHIDNKSESPEPLIARGDSISVKKELKNNR